MFIFLSACSLFPLMMRYLGDDGISWNTKRPTVTIHSDKLTGVHRVLTGMKKVMTVAGIAANPSSHLHPRVGTVAHPMATMPIAPANQKSYGNR